MAASVGTGIEGVTNADLDASEGRQPMGHHTHGQPASRRQVLKTTGLAAGAVLLGASTSTGQVAASTAEQGSASHRDATDVTRDRTNAVEIIAKHDHKGDEHQFDFSTTEISAGWTTITFDNQTDHTHIAYLGKLPQAAIEAADEDGANLLDYYVEHVTRPFQWFMDSLDPAKEPDPDDLSDKYTNLDEEVIFPGWFMNLLPSGGAGFISGHMTSRTSVELEPGKYIVECYVKNDESEFHSYLGMIDLLTVTEGRAGTEPEATLDLSLSTDGIDVAEKVRPGRQTVAVHVEDQQIYEHLLGHDVHLVRLDHRTTLDDVNGWMNWMTPDGLVSDGTEPGTFLGGVQTIVTPGLLEGTETKTAYFDVDLNPGAYAWISEVPDPAENGFLKPFSVPFEQS